MADQAISALTEVTAPNASDMMPIVNSGVTKKVQIQNAVKAATAIWARVTHSTTQSLTNNTLTAISFDTERNDTDVIHDNSTNNSRLTCKTAGVYVISGCLGYASNGTGERSTSIRLNGVTFIASSRGLANSVASATTRHVVTTTVPLAVNDYVELIGFQTSGGILNTEQAANITPEFSMIRVAA